VPSRSKNQHALMEGVANSAKFARKVGIPQKVGRDYANADKGKNIKVLPRRIKKGKH
jgi:hypothetical protein